MVKKFKFRNPVFYRMLYAFVRIMHRLYYRKYTLVGTEKILPNTPYIFAVNHQNALMDALAVLFATGKPVAFIARADIFKKPAIAKILNMLKIIPIYRIRDGYGELGKNQESFDNTIDVLNSGIPLCILPEGNHEGVKRLRQLKKGIFRVAFQAVENSPSLSELNVVAVGLDFSDYFNAGSDLTVVIGSQIRIKDYIDDFHENEARTINNLITILAGNMQNTIIHIPEQNYELIYSLTEIFEPNIWNTCNIKRHPYNKLTIKQYLVQKLSEIFDKQPETVAILSSKLNDYHKKIKELGFGNCSLQQNHPGFISLFIETFLGIIGLPFFLFGFLLNYLPYKLIVSLSRKIKDMHFKSSVQFGLGLIIFPIYYLILTTVFGVFFLNPLLIIAFALSLPVSALFAFYFKRHLQKLFIKIRLFIFKNTHTEVYNSLKEERKQLINLIQTTIKN